MTPEDLQYAMDINDLMRLALRQVRGNSKAAAARLLTTGARWSLSEGISELVIVDRIFELARDHDDELS